MRHAEFPAQVPPPPPDGASHVDPRPDVPWTWLDALGVFFTMLVAVILLGGLLGTLPGLGLLPAEVGEALFLPLSLGVLGLTAAIWVRVRYPGAARRLTGPARARAADVLAAVGFGLAAYLVINVGLGAALQLLAEVADADLPTVQQEFRDAARDRQMAPYFAVGAVLFAPVAEEIFFRGMLFQALRRHLGVWAGAIVSAGAFSLSHVNWGSPLQANLLVFVVIFPLGVFLAWLFHRRGTLVVPILVHAIFNLIGVLLLLSGVA